MPSTIARIMLGTETLELQVDIRFPFPYERLNEARYILETPLIMEPNLTIAIPSQSYEKQIYVIQVGNKNIYRLGYSRDPEAKVAKLQTGNHHTLSIVTCGPGTQSLYDRLRAMFHDKIIRHSEWYRLTLGDVQTIKLEIWKHKYMTQTPSSKPTTTNVESSSLSPTPQPHLEVQSDCSSSTSQKVTMFDPYKEYVEGRISSAKHSLPLIEPIQRWKMNQFLTSCPVKHDDLERIEFITYLYLQLTNKRLDSGDLEILIKSVIHKKNCQHLSPSKTQSYHQAVLDLMMIIYNDSRYNYNLWHHSTTFKTEACQHLKLCLYHMDRRS